MPSRTHADGKLSIVRASFGVHLSVSFWVYSQRQQSCILPSLFFICAWSPAVQSLEARVACRANTPTHGYFRLLQRCVCNSVELSNCRGGDHSGLIPPTFLRATPVSAAAPRRPAVPHRRVRQRAAAARHVHRPRFPLHLLQRRFPPVRGRATDF